MGVGGDAARFGGESHLFHLEGGEIGVVVDTALGEEGDIFETVVVCDDVMQVGVTFAANVFKGFDVEGGLRRARWSTFGIDLAVFDDSSEPREVFVVMGDDNTKAHEGQTITTVVP